MTSIGSQLSSRMHNHPLATGNTIVANSQSSHHRVGFGVMSFAMQVLYLMPRFVEKQNPKKHWQSRSRQRPGVRWPSSAFEG
jgi:hypothetical protein